MVQGFYVNFAFCNVTEYYKNKKILHLCDRRGGIFLFCTASVIDYGSLKLVY